MTRQRFAMVAFCAVLIAAAAAATLASPEHLAALTSDGALSFSLQERIRVLRAVLALVAAIMASIAAWRAWGPGIGLGALLMSALWTAAVVGRLYPNHLFNRPGKLLAAALGDELLLSDFQPKTDLDVPVTDIQRSKFPSINVHAHFHRSTKRTPEEMIKIMDACNVTTTFELDGGLGPELDEDLAKYAQAYPGRFKILANFGFGQQISDWDYFRKEVDGLEEAKRNGAIGIKIWKNLGLWTRDENRKLIPIDDERVDPLWKKAGEIKLPILIHIADLPANFAPLDRFNERYEFLKANLDLAYQGPKAPPLSELLDQFERVVARHREETFILAHLGNRTNSLAAAGELLDRNPNLYFDLSARANELGRQPSTARAFLNHYADRVLFGTDGNPDETIYRGYFRLLETNDDYFNDPRWPRLETGRWKIYGLGLPDETLRKIYRDNAVKLFALPEDSGVRQAQ